ncbi:hypothetical protein SAMN04487886_107614 [Clostridium sp. DSM 8431]|uniref:hypothetical protein n=1 Tax=Clostridium sp. DSM 8431 TaxID=1761781 RepID=UPI0008E1F04B|nr:hypothetical protein [Clostridium sp. DSM 8431]SFU61701.1 hypothetical protein SAMN04487886_107614 [Clostridium sp. DSM 8431]
MKNVKKIIIASVSILCAGLFVGCGSEKVSNNGAMEGYSLYSQEFKLRNNAGSDIVDLRISSAGEEDWGNDITSTKLFKSGYSLDVDFKVPEKYDRWDIKAISSNGETIEWKNVNLENAEIILQYNSEDTSICYK